MAPASGSKSSHSKSSRKFSRAQARKRRERCRAQGLRPIQIWAPDVRLPAFRSEAHRQPGAVAASLHALEDQAFIDAVSEISAQTKEV